MNIFVEKYPAELDAIKRILKRIMVVGSFNPQQEGLFLFTNRPNPSYDNSLFRATRPISYQNFIQSIQPQVNEIAFQLLENWYVVVSTLADNDQRVTIDSHNYFFRRGGKQENFKDYLREEDPGKSILESIKNDIHTFIQFYTRVGEILDLLAIALNQRNPVELGVSFMKDMVFPPGFMEFLLDYIFDEDTISEAVFPPHLPFGWQENDWPWAEQWKSFRGENNHKVKIFGQFLKIFQDFMIFGSSSSVADPKFSTVMQKLLAEKKWKELQNQFTKARDAFNSLKQVLKSKVLLSMIPEYVFHSYYENRDDWNLVGCNDTLQEKILTSGIIHGDEQLPKAIQRLRKKERDAVRDQILKDLSEMLEGILSGHPIEKDTLKAFTEKPENQALLQRLKELYGGDSKEKKEVRTIMIRSFQNLLVDIAMPVLFGDVALTLEELQDMFYMDVREVYFSALLLRNKQVVQSIREIAKEQHQTLQNFLQKNPGNPVLTTSDTQSLSQSLNENVILLIGNHQEPEILEKLQLIHVESQGIALKCKKYASQQEDIKGPGPIVFISHEPKKVPSSSVNTGSNKGISLSSEEINAILTANKEKNSNIQENAGVSKEENILSSLSVREEEKEEKKYSIRKVLETIIVHKEGTSLEEQVKTTQAEIQKRKNCFDNYMNVIYDTYSNNLDKKQFCRKVQRMELELLLLYFQKYLDLGNLNSHLYSLLLDLITSENLEEFRKTYSLTKYFDFNKIPLSILIKGFEYQTKISLENLKHFISDLHGVKYLFDTLEKDTAAEIILWNCKKADDVVEKLQAQMGTQSQHLFNPVTASSNTFILPLFIYFTNSAFARMFFQDTLSIDSIPDPEIQVSQKKQALVNKLDRLTLSQGGFHQILPPVFFSCIKSHANWLDENEQSVARLNPNFPLFLFGPSLPLGEPLFDTTIPAGYIVAAHLLGYPETRRILCPIPDLRQYPRLVFLGRSNASFAQLLKKSLEKIEETPNLGIALFLETLLATFTLFRVSESNEPKVEIPFKMTSYFESFCSGLRYQSNRAEALIALTEYFYRNFSPYAFLQPLTFENNQWSSITLISPTTANAVPVATQGAPVQASMQIGQSEIAWFQTMLNKLMQE